MFTEQERPQQQWKQNITTQTVAEASFNNPLHIRKTMIWLISMGRGWDTADKGPARSNEQRA